MNRHRTNNPAQRAEHIAEREAEVVWHKTHDFNRWWHTYDNTYRSVLSEMGFAALVEEINKPRSHRKPQPVKRTVTMLRYRIGFADPTVKSPLTERNPDYIPVVDTQSPKPEYALGEVVALVADASMAERVCALLNLHEDDAPINEVDDLFGAEGALWPDHELMAGG